MIKNLRLEKGMKTLSVVSLFFLIFAANSLSQTTYYVSSSQGNDSYPGTSQATPWATLEKVNSIQFNPGDQILFRAGDTWKGVLNITSSGTEQSRIYFGNYGSGAKPIITLREEIPAWNIPEKWTQYSENVWLTTIPGATSQNWLRIWLNGIEYVRTQGLGSNNLDGTYGVSTTHRFLLNTSSTQLYLYSPSNPALYYNNIEYPGKVRDSSTKFHSIEMIDADYVELNGLDIQGGMYSAIGLTGCDNVIIRNCEVGKYSNWAGIFGQSSFINALDNTSKNVIIDNNVIASDRKVIQYHYDGVSGVEYGIVLQGGTENWDIYNNKITNWTYNILILGDTRPSINHNIYNNDISTPDIRCGKAIQINGKSSVNDGFTNCNIYNNYFHDLYASGIQLCSNGNKIYFNIFKDIRFSEMPYIGQSNSGSGINLVPSLPTVTIDLRGNYIFNNTFINTFRDPLLAYGSRNYYYNNLLAGGIGTQGHTQLKINLNTTSHFRNNLFFYPSFNANDYMVTADGGAWTLNQFNLLDNLFTNSIIDGNIQHVGSLENLIYSDQRLPLISPALSAGIDISNLIPSGFRDRYGNLVNRANPSIGAVQNNTSPDTTPPDLISSVLLDSAKLLLTFSEQLSAAEITTLTNYFISNGIVVQASQLNSSNPSQVTLFTTAHTFGLNYTIVVSNLKDIAGNVIQSPSNTVNYVCNFNPPPTGEIIKLPIIGATASSAIGVNYGPDKTIDGRYYSNGGDTCWASSPVPQWLIYDLGVAKQISRTRISFYDFQNGRIYTYKVSVSIDFVNWNTIIPNTTSSDQEWTVNEFTPVIARLVKLELINNNQNNFAVVWETEIWGYDSVQPIVLLNSKVFLQGAYQNGLMVNLLNTSGVIPIQQPYNFYPWSYSGNESVQNIPPDVVDWVLVELRNDTSANSVTVKRAAFVTKAGKIVDVDGTSNVSFYGIVNNSYYLVIRHRNHLSIMSANKINLSASLVNYDFTISNTTVFGNELADLGDGKFGMFAGDGDGNGVVNVLDYQTVGNNLFQVGYKAGDLDLNNIINILDYGKTNQNLLKFSKVPGAVIF